MFGKIKKDFVFNILRHAVFLLILYIVQAEVFPWFDGKAIPLILVSASMGIALMEGSFPGTVFGLFAGILTDVSLTQPVMTFTLLLPLLGLFVGWLGENIFAPNFPSYLLFSLIALAISAFVQMFSLMFFSSTPSIRLLWTGLAQTVTGFIAALPLFPVCKWLAQRAARAS